MITRERLIEKMARAIYNESPDIIKEGTGGAVKVVTIPFDEAKNRKAICMLQAEAAFNTLINNLPDVACMEATDRAYQKLMKMGK